MTGVENGNCTGKQVGSDNRIGRNTDGTIGCQFAHLPEHGIGCSVPIHDFFSIFHEGQPFGSQGDFASEPVEQLGTKLLFQSGYVLADSRLRHIEFLCRPGEIAQFGYFHECFKSEIFKHIGYKSFL